MRQFRGLLAPIVAVLPLLAGPTLAQEAEEPAPVAEEAKPVAAVDAVAMAERAMARHFLPAYERLASATEALAEAAPSCEAERIRAAYHSAFDAWMGASHIQLGPIEDDMRRFAIAFWPDAKGFTGKTVARLLKTRDKAVDDPAAFAKISVAARGLMALERLLYDENGPIALDGEDGAYRCHFAHAIGVDLHATAMALLEGWRAPDGHAHWLVTPNADDNPLYFSPEDVTRTLFKTLDSGLEAVIELRLGRPLGTWDRPWPRRAEAWRSGRSLRNAVLSLKALRAYYDQVFADLLTANAQTAVAAAFDRAEEVTARAPAPLKDAVAEPGTRLAVEAAQTQIHELRDLLRKVVAPEIGASFGFNSLDGD